MRRPLKGSYSGWDPIVPREKWNLRTPRLPYYEEEHSSGGPNACHRTEIASRRWIANCFPLRLAHRGHRRAVARAVCASRWRAGGIGVRHPGGAARGDGLVCMPGRAPRRSRCRRRLPGHVSRAGAQGRSLWVRDSLGPWLHRVALRAAFRPDARRIDAKRPNNTRPSSSWDGPTANARRPGGHPSSGDRPPAGTASDVRSCSATSKGGRTRRQRGISDCPWARSRADWRVLESGCELHSAAGECIRRRSNRHSSAT